MSLQYNAYLHRLNLVYDIYKLSPDVKNLILLKYDMLCTSIASSTQDELIKSDIVEYGTICCKSVVKQMLLSKDIFDPNNCTLEALLELYNKLNTGNINETVDEIYKAFSAKIKSLGGLVTPIQNLDELNKALETIGISKTDAYSDEDYMDDSQIIGLDDEDSALLNSIFSDTAQTDAEVGYLDEEDSDYEQSANDGFGDADEIYEDDTDSENENGDMLSFSTDTNEFDEPEGFEDEEPEVETEEELVDIAKAEDTESIELLDLPEIDESDIEDYDDIDLVINDSEDSSNIDIDKFNFDFGETEESSEQEDSALEELINSIDIDESDSGDYTDIDIINPDDEDNTESVDSVEDGDTENVEPEEVKEEPTRTKIDVRLPREIPVMTMLKCINNETWEKPEETIHNYLTDFKYVEQAFKNEFDYSSEMAKDYEIGLAKAIRVYGTLHYVNSIGMLESNRLDNLKNKLSERIVNESNKKASASALGILIAYDNGDMPYDRIPNQALLNRFAKMAFASTSESLIKKKEFKLEGELARLINTYGIGGDPTVYRENSSMAYDESNYTESKIERKTFEKLPSGSYVLKPYKTQTVMAMKPEFATLILPYEAPRDRIKLLYSRNGAKFLYETTWETILDTMSNVAGGDEAVQRVAIAGTEIIVNNSKLFLDNLYDDRSGVDLNAITDIEKLLTRFSGLKQLVVEASLISVIVRKHIVDIPNLHERIVSVLTNIFNLSPSLYRLGVIDTAGSINEPVWYYRNGLEESRYAIIKQLRFESIKLDIEAICAMNSPLLHMKSRSYVHRFFDTTMSDASTANYIFGKLRDQDPSLREMYSKSKSASMTKIIGNTKRGVKGLTGFLKKKDKPK